jgi:uncharacterized Ntn-hydrolase superfamily protein
MTYSIVAIDEAAGVQGVAVASKALCVGAHGPGGASGAGALATQAWHDLRYGWEGLALLEQGYSAAAVVQELTHDDPDAPHRQLGLVDRARRFASFTGPRCLPWAGGMWGRDYAVQGNQLAGAHVVEAMAESFQSSRGSPFVRRIVEALVAGDEAGGDRRGRQSAGVKVWRTGAPARPGSEPVVDLRVDDAELPVHDLAAMLPKLWLEYGLPASGSALPLGGETSERVGAALRVPPEQAQAALRDWAREHNLESRLVPAGIDPVVLDVLESGADAVLAGAARVPPSEVWRA